MRLRWVRWFAAVSLVAGVGFATGGCQRQSSAPQDRVAPNPSAPSLYGPPTGVASKEIPRALSHGRDTNWRSAPFYVLHTELSPAILVHSSTRYLGLFAGLAERGLGAPTHVAWSTRDGPRSFAPGTTHEAKGMEENWLLVWFAGATNWTNWDSPWAVFLQRKPSWVRLDERGLHLEFPASAGDVVMMPLYGYFKLPPAGRDYLAEHGLKSRKLRSWDWEKTLTRDPLTRLRYWAGASREFPIYCEETFSVDRARDEVTVRSRVEWHSIQDEWRTKPVKLAPVSPALALAAKDKNFPARFSARFQDMEVPTPFGPYAGVPGVDTFDVTFPWLHYVNETVAVPPAETNGPPVSAQAGQEGDGVRAANDIAAARRAYRAGDMDRYHYASLRAVQALARVWAARRGADYFLARQPWDSMDWLEGPDFITGFSRESGWQLSGGKLQKDARPSVPESADVARFRGDWLNTGARSALNESARVTAQYQRLIPPGEPSPFVAGSERDAREAHPGLLVALTDGGDGKSSPRWPQVVWPRWKTSGGGSWSFGSIKPVRDGQAVSVERRSLNWNTEVRTYTLP